MEYDKVFEVDKELFELIEAISEHVPYQAKGDVMDNSVLEFIAPHGKRIKVVIKKDDNGQVIREHRG